MPYRNAEHIRRDVERDCSLPLEYRLALQADLRARDGIRYQVLACGHSVAVAAQALPEEAVCANCERKQMQESKGPTAAVVGRKLNASDVKRIAPRSYRWRLWLRTTDYSEATPKLRTRLLAVFPEAQGVKVKVCPGGSKFNDQPRQWECRFELPG